MKAIDAVGDDSAIEAVWDGIVDAEFAVSELLGRYDRYIPVSELRTLHLALQGLSLRAHDAKDELEQDLPELEMLRKEVTHATNC